MPTLTQLKKDLNKLADRKQAAILSRFFKTGPGAYGEGDVFLGIKVPEQRKAAGKYADLSLADTQKLLKSKIHEHRLVALLILVKKFKKGGEKLRAEIFKAYLKNTRYINNWDLVDLSAPNIVGRHLLDKSRQILYKLVRSKSLWGRRIAVLATFSFIRENDFRDSLRLSEILLKDEHDLIHKATGWMLREIGKRDQAVLERFLRKYYQVMPRTMLRYAIEKFDEKKRKFYLGK